ncbi:MAG: leishmanolysin-related zinc metalloendopeptidase [Planctomycetota bacterium]
MAQSLSKLELARFDPAILGSKKKSKTKKRAFSDASDCNSDHDNSSNDDNAAGDSNSEFEIEVRFQGGLTTNQQDAFATAAARWSEIIVGDLQAVRLPTGEVVDDVLIDASGTRIDGPGRVLGRAAPTLIRQNKLPAAGFMEFDVDDLRRMESDGTLVDVIIHEMGHVLGVGTLWGELDLVTTNCLQAANPVFFGLNAANELGAILGVEQPIAVPVENQHGPGTRCGHWRETIFGHEGMTGFVNQGPNPISRMTVGALEDMGYEVNYDAADSYSLPSQLSLMMMGIGDDRSNQRCCSCAGAERKTQPVLLPEEMHL